MDVTTLNDRYGMPQHVAFVPGPGGIPMAEIRNEAASALISLQGAQVLSFQPTGQEPVLWVSSGNSYQPGIPVRGGVPICWPWFGPHATDASKPNHGFARKMMWEVSEAGMLGNDVTLLRLELPATEAMRALWDVSFKLSVVIRVGKVLEVELITENLDNQPVSYTAALHTYLRVGDVTQITLNGLDGTTYVDQADQFTRKVQSGAVMIGSETDRVYLNTEADCVVTDPVMQRTIRVTKRGSRSTVIWNPWAVRVRTFNDFPPDEYPQMVCVETANVFDDAVLIPANSEHRLATVISVE